MYHVLLAQHELYVVRLTLRPPRRDALVEVIANAASCFQENANT